MDNTKDLHEMCEILSRELGEANDKIRNGGGKLSGSDLDYVDKLTHALKSIKTTIAMAEADEGGSYDGDRMYSGRMYPYRGSYNDGSYRSGSYARRRDSRGRYAMDADMAAELRELMQKAPDEQTRMDFQRLIDKIERM